MTTVDIIGLSACLVLLCSLVGLYRELQRERMARIVAEQTAEDLDAAYLLVIRDVNEAFAVGRAVVRAEGERERLKS